MTFDNVFFVSSAIKTEGRLSLYSDEKRFHQTVDTVNSINKYCSQNKIFIIDGSATPMSDDILSIFRNMNVEFCWVGQDRQVQSLSQGAHKTLAELLGMKLFLNWYLAQNIQSKRIYKVSGRYVLNDNFRLGHEYENSFVFKKSVESWMPKEDQERTGMTRFYETRIFHMDSKLLPSYDIEIGNMIDVCLRYNVNMEHSMYHCLHGKYNIIELDKMGLNGYIAPSGEYKDD
jgi:hypothetical protein